MTRDDPRLLVFRLDVSEPSLNAGQKVRPIAMRASQRSGVAWEIGKALRVQVDISFDLVSGRRAYKSQYRHHYLLISGAAERPHGGSPRQKLQGQVGQHQQTDSEEHHGPNVFDLDVFQIHLDLVAYDNSTLGERLSLSRSGR